MFLATATVVAGKLADFIWKMHRVFSKKYLEILNQLFYNLVIIIYNAMDTQQIW